MYTLCPSVVNFPRWRHPPGIIFTHGISLTTVGVVDAAGLRPDQSGLPSSKGSFTNRDLEIYIHFHYTNSINDSKLFLRCHIYRRFQVPGTTGSGSSYAPRAASSNMPLRKFYFCTIAIKLDIVLNSIECPSGLLGSKHRAGTSVGWCIIETYPSHVMTPRMQKGD